jgi:purine nucleosidase
MKFPLVGFLVGWFLVAGLSPPAGHWALAADPLPVIIDTDFGSDIDDAFALGLAFVSPELEVVAITTVGAGNEFDPYVGQRKDWDDHRAWMVTRFLTQTKYVPPPPKDRPEERTPAAFSQSILQGAQGIPVAAGAEPQPKMPIGAMIQYRRHPAAIYNRTLKPVKESAVELMASVLKEREGVEIIALGPLTNIARLIQEHPEAARRIKRIIVMGGAVRIGYGGKPSPEPEWNIQNDIPAAQTVFQAKIPLLVVPLDATATVALQEQQRRDLFAAHTPLTWQIQNLYELWTNENKDPVLFDAVAVAAAFRPDHLTIEELPLQVNDAGLTVEKAGGRKIPVATKVDAQAFLDWYVARVKAAGNESLPEPPKNVSKLIDPGNFPARVHTFEDYETDIEKRWVMSGKVVPDPENKANRICEAVLTQDFDDRQGQTQTMYRAVIFNPVPGPPMGPNTRLKFRYKLVGTDTLRVQLYSLTNGYHRYLSLTGLAQGQWLDGCVDMTQMRRPDGTGGPLAENERIDDIQFYVDPRATVLIDNIVMYDAAPPTETRPFPQRIIFTGWFDTGKQGKEWPGTFDIVEHSRPRQWKFAQAVKQQDGTSLLSVSLRGDRTLERKTVLSVLLHKTDDQPVSLQLFHKGKPVSSKVEKIAPRHPPGRWEAVTCSFDFPGRTIVDEVRFTGADGTNFGIDDLLLYAP